MCMIRKKPKINIWRINGDYLCIAVQVIWFEVTFIKKLEIRFTSRYFVGKCFALRSIYLANSLILTLDTQDLFSKEWNSFSSIFWLRKERRVQNYFYVSMNNNCVYIYIYIYIYMREREKFRKYFTSYSGNWVCCWLSWYSLYHVSSF